MKERRGEKEIVNISTDHGEPVTRIFPLNS